MTHDSFSPLRVLWWAFWLKPAVDYGRGKITFGRMILRYFYRVYFLFFFIPTLYGIYIYHTTPDRVWERPKPQTLEETTRLRQPSVFDQR